MVWMSSHANADEKNCLNPFDMKLKGIPPVLSYSGGEVGGLVPRVKKPQSKSGIMLLCLHVSWLEITLAQQYWGVLHGLRCSSNRHVVTDTFQVGFSRTERP